MNLFVISDIHGMYKPFVQLLEHWNRDDKLVILGDMIDRGPQSLEVVRKIMELKMRYGPKIVVLMGNHDQMLLDFIDSPNEYGYNWQYNGGNETIRSFVKDDTVFYDNFVIRAMRLLDKCHEEWNFIKELPRYYQTGKLLFTHAGFNPFYRNWEETTDNEFIWIRDHYKQPNETGLINVFGHTPTQLINQDGSNDIWVSKCGTYIGIDGACAYDGQLNGLLINEQGEILEKHSVNPMKEEVLND